MCGMERGRVSGSENIRAQKENMRCWHVACGSLEQTDGEKRFRAAAWRNLLAVFSVDGDWYRALKKPIDPN